MQDDSSTDVTTIDDDIADLPLFGDNTQPATAEAPAEATSTTEDNAETKGSETEEATESDKTDAEAKDTEATEQKIEDTAQTDEQTAKGQPDPAIARQAYLERQRTRQAVEQQIDQTYAPKSQDELYQEAIDQGLTEDQAMYKAEVQALREEMNYAQQRTQIAELNAGMQAEAVNAMSDFPVFNEKSPDYDPDFTTMVEQQYKTAARLQADDNGIILNAEIPLYDFYKSMADIYNRGASKGATKAQAETTETLSRVESVAGGSSSTSRGPETLEEMAERLGDLPLI